MNRNEEDPEAYRTAAEQAHDAYQEGFETGMHIVQNKYRKAVMPHWFDPDAPTKILRFWHESDA